MSGKHYGNRVIVKKYMGEYSAPEMRRRIWKAMTELREREAARNGEAEYQCGKTTGRNGEAEYRQGKDTTLNG